MSKRLKPASPEPAKQPLWGTLFSTVMAVFCVPVGWHGFSQLQETLAVRNWPTVPGAVQRSELLKEFIGVVQYTADIEYTYKVDGTEYQSTSVRPRGQSNQRRLDIEPLVDEYHAGRGVDVFYNPADPSESYLTTSLGFGDFALFGGPIMFGFLFGGMAVSGFRERIAAAEAKT